MNAKRAPPKLAKFILWCSTSKESREDMLIAYDEMFENAVEKFGLAYGYIFAWSQAIRSIPYGLIAGILKFVGFVAKLVS